MRLKPQTFEDTFKLSRSVSEVERLIELQMDDHDQEVAALSGQLEENSFRVKLKPRALQLGTDVFQAFGRITADGEGSIVTVQYRLPAIGTFVRWFGMIFTLLIGTGGGLVLLGQLLNRSPSEISTAVWIYGAVGFPLSLIFFAIEYVGAGFDRQPDELRAAIHHIFSQG